jgi:hypothetical protein
MASFWSHGAALRHIRQRSPITERKPRVVTMASLTTGDMVILAVAGYIAVVSLVRLMLGRRDQVAARVSEQYRQERRRRQRGEQREKAKKLAEQLRKQQDEKAA